MEVSTGICVCRDMAKKYKIKHFYDITDRSDFKANPDYKGVCHIAMAQEGHCLPGGRQAELTSASYYVKQCVANFDSI